MWTLHNGNFSTVLISHTRTSKSRNVRKLWMVTPAICGFYGVNQKRTTQWMSTTNSVPNDLQTNFSQSFLVSMRRSKIQKTLRWYSQTIIGDSTSPTIHSSHACSAVHSPTNRWCPNSVKLITSFTFTICDPHGLDMPHPTFSHVFHGIVEPMPANAENKFRTWSGLCHICYIRRCNSSRKSFIVYELWVMAVMLM